MKTNNDAGRATLATLAASAVGLLGVLAWASALGGAPTANAESVMVAIDYDSDAYQIEGTVTWTHDKACSNTYYRVMVPPPEVTCVPYPGGGPQCLTPPSPPPHNGPVPNLAQKAAAKASCAFFCGGVLPDYSEYETRPSNVTSGPSRGKWTFKWTYTGTADGASIEPRTCWNSAETGGDVDVAYTGFVAAEHFQLKPDRSKYGFSLLETPSLGNPSGSLVRDVRVELLKYNPDTLAYESLVAPTAVPETDGFGYLPATSAIADFTYHGNGGVFGKAAAMPGLHAGGGKPANLVHNILNGLLDDPFADNFAGNDAELAAGAVHQAWFSGGWAGLTLAGEYQTRVTGIVRGRDALADAPFTVLGKIVIGGCTCNP